MSRSDGSRVTQRDYYEILGVDRDAKADQIKSAYRKLARKYHPDVNKAQDAEEKFREATEAYNVLSDPEKRKIYDQFGHAGLKGGDPFAGAGQGPQPGATSYRWSSGPGQGAGFEDIFGQGDFMHMGLEEILRNLGGMGGMGGGRRAGPSARPRRGQNLQSEVTLEFLQAARGTTVSLQLRRPEPSAQPETLHVKIPAGVREGSKIRLRGKGGKGPAGAGDLLITTHVKGHPYFQREGNDLYVDVPISITEATLGASIEVPTLEGTSKIKIPGGSSSSRQIRLKGKGIAPAGGSPGDLYVRLSIVPPDPGNLTESQKRKLEELDKELGFDPRRDAPWSK